VFQADVVVVGGGLIGLACATEVAGAGLRTLVVSSSEPGAASPASAGILAPSVGNVVASVRALGVMSRDMYPAYVEALASRTGISIPLDRSGVLEVAFTEDEAASLRSSLVGGEWLNDAALREREPGLAPAIGGTFHVPDGSVDVATLLEGLRTEASRDQRLSIMEGRVVAVQGDTRGALIELDDGRRVRGERVVVAAGAWAGAIRGLPRPIPVLPVRGQMVAFDSPPMRHVVMGPRGYVVRRGGRSLVGSTMEHVGFDPRTTPEGAALLRRIGAELSPSLEERPIVAHWAGLRPVTPDLLPIIGADPECERVLYACGHSRNGVLLAPLTARVVTELVTRGASAIDVTPYAPDRFPTMNR
jgi:glycine oxidase